MRARVAIVMAGLALVSVSAQQTTAPTTPPPAAPTATATAAAPPPATDCRETAAALTRLLANDVRLRDWPALARYRDANRTLAPAASSDARVVFMGDSITDAWPQPRYGEFFVGKPYVGRGISGQTTPQMLVRFRQDVLDLKPRIVVILAGTNDIAGNTGIVTDEDIEGNLASMAELAKASGIRVVLASITPVSEYHVAAGGTPQTTSRPLSRIRAVNAWIQKYAAAQGHTYLDYFSAMVDDVGMLREDLSADDLHPNAKGYAVMAPLAEAAIRAALTKR